MYGGICDDPIQVDVVYVLDRDLQGDVVGATTSFGDFDQLKGFMADLLDNFVIDSATNTDKNLAFGMVTVDGNGVYSDGATGGSLSLSSNNFVAGLKAAISTRTLGVGADNDNFLEGINAGLDMLAASQDIGQSQALVVFVDKNTWESANKDTCSTLSDRMTGISLLFIEIGTFNTVGNCFGTATRLPQSSYSDLAVSNEDNEALCGATLLETYFGDYTFDTSAVSTDGSTRYSFALNTRTDAIIWNGGSWEITNDAGSTASGTSDNHPYPPYSLFYGLGIFNRQIILAKCYNPPTLSPTQEPTVEPTDNPTSPTLVPTNCPTKEPTANPTINPTASPTGNPTIETSLPPTKNPTYNPSLNPTSVPTKAPSRYPTADPSASPILSPSINPTLNPSLSPTNIPSSNPTFTPSESPSFFPTFFPTQNPTSNPSHPPSASPTYNKNLINKQKI